MNVESRHIDAREAGQKVEAIAREAYRNGVQCVYKKTDSALRGNIGAELEALLRASGCSELGFVPAFPKIRRTTAGGYHYIDGVQVHQSVFGRDPFSPIKNSYIPDIIALQSKVPVILDRERPEQALPPHICVYDAQSNQDLIEIIRRLRESRQWKALAGCAGLAEYLPELLGLPRKAFVPGREKMKMLVVSGSLNDISIGQIRMAKQSGFPVVTLTLEQKLLTDYWRQEEGEKTVGRISELLCKSGIVIVESVSRRQDCAGEQTFALKHRIPAESLRVRTTENISVMVKRILETVHVDVLVVFGGETLMSILRNIGCVGLIPTTEISSGTVLSRMIGQYDKMAIVSKSGGMGEANILPRIYRYFQEDAEARRAIQDDSVALNESMV